MNEKEFCYWLKGYFEMTNSEHLQVEQVKMIRDHLDLVFTKVTPDRVLYDNNLPSTQVLC